MIFRYCFKAFYEASRLTYVGLITQSQYFTLTTRSAFNFYSLQQLQGNLQVVKPDDKIRQLNWTIFPRRVLIDAAIVLWRSIYFHIQIYSR